ncbi:MAG TPA: peptidyl-prolyl cis-trans isomerase [Thermoanaerobaculia bacterium]|nr:peptidyl-prolyl cis-trans isomerase [Thermoanaerobaculia bacterium]
MKRTLVSLALLAVGASAFGQQQAAATNTNNSKSVVALVNGEAITRDKLDQLWERMSPKMKLQYERNGGGKMGFLDNYIRKVLMVQEAKKNGFDAKPGIAAEMQAASESALFDAYVRDVIASTVVTDAELRKFYDDNLPDFTSEQARLRLIRVAKGDRPAEAREAMSGIMTGLLDARTALAKEGKHVRELATEFGKVAERISQDPSADRAGELGWVERGRLPAKLEEAAFSMPLETVSGIIEMEDSFALIYLEERGNRTEPFEEVSGTIREYLLGRKQRDIVDAVNKTTAGLRARAQVQTFPQNIE